MGVSTVVEEKSLHQSSRGVCSKSCTVTMLDRVIFLLLSVSLAFGQGDNCEEVFEMQSSSQTLGGVCYDETSEMTSPEDIQLCLCACKEDESCKAVDWNISDTPWEGCRCWFHTQEITTEDVVANENVNQWTKKSGPVLPVCNTQQGDGVDSTGDPYGSEHQVADAATEEECVQNVLNEYPTANGMTYTVSGECYAEMDMVDRDGHPGIVSCIFE